MATVIYCDDFSEQLALGVHNFGSHTFKLALTNTAITTSAGQVFVEAAPIKVLERD